ncbi:Rieske (2Fe-2S) protein [Natronolimnohabitans innermongolicus]|uniref:Rieske (2Fe-2S) iron-sulfur domain-containing protein n=1 Tax=Natronolimnohabitans innermongolicus JCM 12255 TaxID=1227499 RepID=L9WN97_9EURY|nr:Rieske (2Fe-2S) protein [Natronolimnohabitans innermongolicus]ELY50945.1 Rieske (2Fe-2S) iron-sulfur domain-containing protein [Natronolimnohabitans innermongolicus JCM 12255]
MSIDNLVLVKAADEFDDGDHELVDVDGVEVGVVRADGEFYAFRNQCPHDGGPVCKGPVSQKLVGEFVEPGERVEKKFVDEMIISCPWHGWSFDLETGENVADDSIILPSYDVVVDDGVVYVDDGN